MQESSHPIQVYPCEYLSGANVGPTKIKHKECRKRVRTAFSCNQLSIRPLALTSHANAAIIRSDSDRFHDTVG